MEPVIVLLATLVVMVFVSRLIASRLTSQATLLVLVVIHSTFVGFLQNLYDRHPVIHASKFALVGLVAVLWLLGHGRGGARSGTAIRTPLDGPIKVLALLYAVQIVNPVWSSATVGLLNGLVGIAQFLLPVALFYVAVEAVERRDHVLFLMQVLVGLSTLMAIGGLAQHAMGYEAVAGLSDSFASTLRREHLWLPGQDDEILNVRAPSFAQDAGAASKYYCLGLIAVASLLVPGISRRANTYLLVSGAIQALALVLTLVRSSVVGTLLGLAFVLWMQRRFRKALVGAMILLAIPLAAELTDLPIGVRFSGLADPDVYVQSRGLQFEALWWVILRFPLGYGVGRAGPGGQMFSTPHDMEYGVPPESLFVNIFFEAGVLGGLVLVWIFWRLIRRSLDIVHSIDEMRLRGASAGVAAIVLSVIFMSFAGATLYTSPTSFVFWAFSGLLFKIEWIDRRDRLLAGRPDAAERGSPHGSLRPPRRWSGPPEPRPVPAR